jgi:hypothetical protein
MAQGRMPPPGSGGKGVAIIIGPAHDGGGAGKPGRMPPPGMKDEQGDGKASAEEAGVVLDSMHCIDCKNYHADSGDCDLVSGSLSPQDGCKWFEEASEPDADDQQGAPQQPAEGGPQE